ncbi:hypothetical protein CR513_03477, partial [Mucuna pruriens]
MLLVYLKQPLGFESDVFLDHVFKLKRLFMDSNKHLMLVLEEELFFAKITTHILSLYKFMWRILYLEQLMNLFVKNFLNLCRNNLKTVRIKKVDQTIYTGIIGSFHYLNASRPNIMFSVYLCARFQVDPRESHLIIERKNTNGGCHFIRANLVSLASKRQGTISLSSVELLPIKHQLEDYDIFESNIHLLCDNIVVINFSKNTILYFKSKHIEIKHHFIRDYIQKEILDMKFISIDEHLVGTSTKPIPAYERNLLNMTLVRKEV